MASPAKSFNPLPKSDLPKRLRHVRKNVACRQASVSMRGVLVRIKAPRLPKLRKRRRREGAPAREFTLPNPIQNFVTHVSTRFPWAQTRIACHVRRRCHSPLSAFQRSPAFPTTPRSAALLPKRLRPPCSSQRPATSPHPPPRAFPAIPQAPTY